MVRPCAENEEWQDCYVGECVGNRSVVRPRKTWINTVKGCLKKASGKCFIAKKFKLLALTEAKMKGNGEVSLCGIAGVCGRLQESGRVR